MTIEDQSRALSPAQLLRPKAVYDYLICSVHSLLAIRFTMRFLHPNYGVEHMYLNRVACPKKTKQFSKCISNKARIMALARTHLLTVSHCSFILFISTIYLFSKRSMGLGRLNPFNVASVIEVNNRTKSKAAYPSDHAHTKRICCSRNMCPENIKYKFTNAPTSTNVYIVSAIGLHALRLHDMAICTD